MYRKPFSFQGRTRRLELVISVVILFAISLVVGIAFAPKLPPYHVGLIALPVTWLFLAQGVKRCHDLGKPWWWFFVPFFVLWMLIAAGEQRVNQFGLSPKS
ncbi:MAG: DUF805 domain-containing protein [Flavobacteriales bacterium]|jgi:uncharacterized membrane protein YhaH (DUF805 family)|nr:DUF805 domain-containing protein [Flavobacteriales bacterium]MBK9514426.1 DUF805 domain-containing protein [Flavobacteriales bacterium]MBP7448636.1 DUF805 domain-containing protein [Flavobacteriales bacterium]HOZ40421.1 DUF805 domain-containing protein [Flavobacteriales bacterium]